MNKNEIKLTAGMYEIIKVIDEKAVQYAMLCTVRDLLREDDAYAALELLEEINLGEVEE